MQHAVQTAARGATHGCCGAAGCSSETPALLGLGAGGEYEDAAEKDEAREKGWLDKVLTGGGSTLALAFLCNKALFPIRTPITLALTPAVAR